MPRRTLEKGERAGNKRRARKDKPVTVGFTRGDAKMEHMLRVD